MSQISGYCLLLAHQKDEHYSRHGCDYSAVGDHRSAEKSNQPTASHSADDDKWHEKPAETTWNSAPTSTEESAAAVAENDPTSSTAIRYALFRQASSSSPRGCTGGPIVGFRHSTTSLLVVCAIVASLFLVVGCAVPALRLQGSGLIVGGGTFSSKYNFFDLILLFCQHGVSTGTVGFGGASILVSLVVVLGVVVVPLAQIVVLLRIWMLPASWTKQLRLKRLSDALGQFNWADLFLVAILACAVFSSSIVSYLVDPFSRQFAFVMDTLATSGFIASEDAYVFAVNAAVSYGTFVWMLAIIPLTLLRVIVSTSADHCLFGETAEPDDEKEEASLDFRVDSFSRDVGSTDRYSCANDLCVDEVVDRLHAPQFSFADSLFSLLMEEAKHGRTRPRSAYA